MDDQQPPKQDQHKVAQRAYNKMKSLSQGMTARTTTRTASRLSRWENPTYVQWKDINQEVTK